MHYRKITVNDKEYEYVVGKWDTKVKGVGVFRNKDWAYGLNPDDGEFMVSPRHIKGMILGVSAANEHPEDGNV